MPLSALCHVAQPLGHGLRGSVRRGGSAVICCSRHLNCGHCAPDSPQMRIRGWHPPATVSTCGIRLFVGYGEHRASAAINVRQVSAPLLLSVTCGFFRLTGARRGDVADERVVRASGVRSHGIGQRMSLPIAGVADHAALSSRCSAASNARSFGLRPSWVAARSQRRAGEGRRPADCAHPPGG